MDTQLEVNPGEVLAGKYRIDRLLGQGGMGVVVAATHLQLDEVVAIKFLLPNALQNPEAVARFAREARAAVKIRSEHVARVRDVGMLETGCPYMVMEYLHGQDLSALVQERGALPIEEAVDYVLQACEALAEAHSLGIIHRDLKPGNLFLSHRADGSSCVKVLDFGISKITGLAGSGPDFGMTKTTTVMGSPLYMSPEQMASSRDVDARTDIWALGVILYELLTGRVPFLADTMPQLCAMILQQPAPPLRNFRPDAPEGLQVALLRTLEKDSARRFRTVAELATALLPFAPRSSRTSVERISRVLSAAGLSGTQIDVPSSTPSLQPHATQAAWDHTTPTVKSRTPWIVVAVAGIAVAATGVFLLLGSRDEAEANVNGGINGLTGPGTSATNPAPSVAPIIASSLPVVSQAEPSSSAANVASLAAASSAKASGGPHAGHKATARPARPPVVAKAPAPLTPAVTVPPPKRPATDLYSDRK